jgi:hypothetical protein
MKFGGSSKPFANYQFDLKINHTSKKKKSFNLKPNPSNLLIKKEILLFS